MSKHPVEKIISEIFESTRYRHHPKYLYTKVRKIIALLDNNDTDEIDWIMNEVNDIILKYPEVNRPLPSWAKKSNEFIKKIFRLSDFCNQPPIDGFKINMKMMNVNLIRYYIQVFPSLNEIKRKFTIMGKKFGLIKSRQSQQ